MSNRLLVLIVIMSLWSLGLDSFPTKAGTPNVWQDILIRADDGPDSKETLLFLGALKKCQVRNAVFNLIGQHIDPNHDGKITLQTSRIVAALAASGYEIGIHTFSHPLPRSRQPLSSYSRRQFVLEIVKTQKAINRALRQAGRQDYFAKAFAVPGGPENLPRKLAKIVVELYDPQSPNSVYQILKVQNLAQVYPQISRENAQMLVGWKGLQNDIGWDIDTRDSFHHYSRLSPLLIAKKIHELRHKKKGRRIIVLLHERKNWQKEIVTLDHLLKNAYRLHPRPGALAL